MIRYADDTRDVEHAIHRKEKGRIKENLRFKLRCCKCFEIPPTTERLVIVGRKIFCETDAWQYLSQRDIGLTEAMFRERQIPAAYEGYDGIPPLYRYLVSPFGDHH
jgi:hypothetical protein